MTNIFNIQNFVEYRAFIEKYIYPKKLKTNSNNF